MRESNLAFWKILPLLSLIAGLTVLFYYSPTEHSFYGKCPFLSVTGLECAGCGTLRGAHALLHGHFVEAFQYNALLVTALPFLLFGLSIELGFKKREGQLFRFYQWVTRWWIVVIVVVAWTILRNVI